MWSEDDTVITVIRRSFINQTICHNDDDADDDNDTKKK